MAGSCCSGSCRGAGVLAVVGGPDFFHRDSALWLFPARWFVRQALLSGQSPAWNPYQGLGFPLLADPQYALFLPAAVALPARARRNGGLTLTSWFSLAHLIWGGLGVALLTRRTGGVSLLGRQWLAWRGLFPGTLPQPGMIGPLLLGHAWIPWVARRFSSV